MKSKLYAVIDTNVIVSAMFTHNPESPTKLILDHVLQGDVIPLYADEIISEYQAVLSREQFSFRPENIEPSSVQLKDLDLPRGRKMLDARSSRIQRT